MVAIAGLYLRADIDGIRRVIDEYSLATILMKYLLFDHKRLATVPGFGQEMSKQLASEAFASSSHRSSSSMSRQRVGSDSSREQRRSEGGVSKAMQRFGASKILQFLMKVCVPAYSRVLQQCGTAKAR